MASEPSAIEIKTDAVPTGVKGLFIALTVGCVAALILNSLPGIDLALSRLFYDPAQHTFPLWQAAFFRFVNDLVEFVAVAAAIAVVVGLAVSIIRKRSVVGLTRRAWSYLLLCLAIGPGLIANVMLKEHWGRARPRHIVEFGGSLHFTPVFTLSDQCATNCSFVSGDTSLAFSFLALALIVRPRAPHAVALALAFGVFIGFIRIAQGAHFLSDTVFAGVLMALTVCVLHLALIEPRPGGPIRARVGARGGWRYPLWLYFRAQPDDVGAAANDEP